MLKRVGITVVIEGDAGRGTWDKSGKVGQDGFHPLVPDNARGKISTMLYTENMDKMFLVETLVSSVSGG